MSTRDNSARTETLKQREESLTVSSVRTRAPTDQFAFSMRSSNRNKEKLGRKSNQGDDNPNAPESLDDNASGAQSFDQTFPGEEMVYGLDDVRNTGSSVVQRIIEATAVVNDEDEQERHRDEIRRLNEVVLDQTTPPPPLLIAHNIQENKESGNQEKSFLGMLSCKRKWTYIFAGCIVIVVIVSVSVCVALLPGNTDSQTSSNPSIACSSSDCGEIGDDDDSCLDTVVSLTTDGAASYEMEMGMGFWTGWANWTQIFTYALGDLEDNSDYVLLDDCLDSSWCYEINIVDWSGFFGELEVTVDGETIIHAGQGDFQSIDYGFYRWNLPFGNCDS